VDKIKNVKKPRRKMIMFLVLLLTLITLSIGSSP